ncbi:MFS transporter [Citrobacter portucalensis]|mgnify:FL=1|uniref:MFS transporter n=5 Tax=Citrobacter freundii complex TaxID=1344959 RepID=A0A5B0TCB6_9ENTR|nr:MULTISPECIES: MFS transporter [Citrobacter]MBJ8707259.1 MFS transporter [Citrobacter freundii]ETX65077.1 nucleoside:H+ symporter [Citrobacter portucalensis]KAA1145020.1 nucleoside permease [Citrobacter portucalensis]KAA1147547.1 nucleoside permease [Citrobacter portucalensis]MBW9454287.1 MFS transporter [Citrobacter portucalensis]
MVSTTESSGKQSVQYRLLVPRLSLMMFLQFFIWGSWSVTLGLVMSQHNMSLLIGDAFSAGPIASILSPFVLGMLVDRFFASQKVMAVMHLAGAAILWFVPQALVAQNGALLIGLLFGYTLCYMPTLALTNNIAFHSLSDKDKTFPVVRVFGTIGWIVAGIFIGVTGISDTTGIFTLAAIISVILALYSLTLPNTPAPAKGLPVKVRDLFCADAFALLKVRHFFVFSLCATLISVPLGTYYAYTASFLADAGVGDVSTAMSFGQMSEIFFMLVIPFLFRRLGVKYMLLIGMCAWFVRYAFFALGISEEGRFLLYLGILLHGVCYDFFFVVGFIYTDRIAGEKVKGQAQSMIVMFTYGIGMLLGSQISGALYNRLVAGQTVPQAWTTFWWIPAVAAAVIALIFLFSFKYDDKEQA